MKSATKVYILGVSLTKFSKPRQTNDYIEMGHEAGVKALLDARITYDDVDRGVACYCYGDSTCGQAVFYQFGMTGIPVYSVNNNCATGSTGIALGRDFIRAGEAQCVMAVGFEKMAAGSLQTYFNDRVDPLTRAPAINNKTYPSDSKASLAVQLFGNAAKEYIEKSGANADDFAEVARINHSHSQKNPYAQFQQAYSKKEVRNSPVIHWPLTKLQCCPTSDGAAAAILVSQSFLNFHSDLKAEAVEIVGQCLATDGPRSYDETAINLAGFDMTQHAAQVALAEAELSIKHIKVVELHDCVSANEVLAIDALGLSTPGRTHEYVRNGQATHGSNVAVVNPSGGLISKGHPLGATRIAQCAELVWQLRGWANSRHVPVKAGQAALQHNAGLRGAIVISILRRADGSDNRRASSSDVGKLNGLGYNPAVEAREITGEQADSVKSRRRSRWAEFSPTISRSDTQM